MALGIWFWILMLLWFLSSLWVTQPNTPKWGAWGVSLLLFLLFLIVGLREFGSPIK